MKPGLASSYTTLHLTKPYFYTLKGPLTKTKIYFTYLYIVPNLYDLLLYFCETQKMTEITVGLGSKNEQQIHNDSTLYDACKLKKVLDKNVHLHFDH